MSLYGDAVRALRRVILIEERVRNTAADLARISQDIVDLRERASRLKGMVAAPMAVGRSDRRRLSGPSNGGS
ncbi:MAG TPA: hypothetical protein VFQ82_14700 [Stellaceae bacterium]|nr:hypothetical protein [Stellaceae bacterium]